MIFVNKNRRLSKNKTNGGFFCFIYLFLEEVSKNISQSRFRLP